MHGRRFILSAIAAGVALTVGNLSRVGAVTPTGTPVGKTGGAADLRTAAESAVSEDLLTAQAAISTLRRQGPAGLQALCEAHQRMLASHLVPLSAKRAPVAESASAEADESRWRRLKQAIDAVGGQYDCYASRLYWYTDLEDAKAAARRAGKPILSLRLLGNLTDQYSCANSRFFRSTLYANAEVAAALRERFVLHWKSVRPVPVVTIDFGDGRSMKRTVTGNSIHYVLDSAGRPVDALPGLYGAKAFIEGLDRAAPLAIRCASLDAAARANELRSYHARRSNEVRARWQDDLRQLGLLSSTPAVQSVSRFKAAPPNAAQANQLALPKAQAEAPILASVLPDAQILTSATDDDAWKRIAQLHAADAKLDDASLRFVRTQNPLAGRAGALAITKRVVEDPLLRVIGNLQETIAIDTVRNEYTFHRQIHEWFAAEQIPSNNLEKFNERVYAELFLTPAHDRWYGLLPAAAYTGLEDNGVCANE